MLAVSTICFKSGWPCIVLLLHPHWFCNTVFTLQANKLITTLPCIRLGPLKIFCVKIRSLFVKEYKSHSKVSQSVMSWTVESEQHKQHTTILSLINDVVERQYRYCNCVPCDLCHDITFLNFSVPQKPVYSDQTFFLCEHLACKTNCAPAEQQSCSHSPLFLKLIALLSNLLAIPSVALWWNFDSKDQRKSAEQIRLHI